MGSSQNVPADHVEFEVTPCHDLSDARRLVSTLIFLDSDDVAILVPAGVRLFLPPHDEESPEISKSSISLIVLNPHFQLRLAQALCRDLGYWRREKIDDKKSAQRCLI